MGWVILVSLMWLKHSNAGNTNRPPRIFWDQLGSSGLVPIEVNVPDGITEMVQGVGQVYTNMQEWWQGAKPTQVVTSAPEPEKKKTKPTKKKKKPDKDKNEPNKHVIINIMKTANLTLSNRRKKPINFEAKNEPNLHKTKLPNLKNGTSVVKVNKTEVNQQNLIKVHKPVNLQKVKKPEVTNSDDLQKAKSTTSKGLTPLTKSSVSKSSKKKKKPEQTNDKDHTHSHAHKMKKKKKKEKPEPVHVVHHYEKESEEYDHFHDDDDWDEESEEYEHPVKKKKKHKRQKRKKSMKKKKKKGGLMAATKAVWPIKVDLNKVAYFFMGLFGIWPLGGYD